ncbi:MAG: phosphotransferase [Sulfuricurvum sp.]|nr:phosphotransferase [Sulfuricurvum sp.]
MGIKTAITLEEVSHIVSCTLLTPTVNGVSDSVYLTDESVLKLFESASASAILEEKALLLHLSHLPVTKHISDIFFLQKKPCVLYEKLNGKSLIHADNHHIIQIAGFMRRLHQQTAGIASTNTPLFESSRLQALIRQTQHVPFQEIFDSIDLELSCDGVIHGDLFLDNVLFDNGELSGVFDFIEACEGDFLFDLAVVAISWCLDEKGDYSKVDLLLTCYNADISVENFIPYMKYALLYYSTTRYLNHRDYQSLLVKINFLNAYPKGTM